MSERLINWLIKSLIKYKYKKEPFMSWCWGIDEHTDIHIISYEYFDDYYRCGTITKFYKSEKE